jgi:hypothetical protein
VIACQVWRDITDVMDPDTELMAVIEVFRRRQLAQIDAQLANSALSRLRRRPRSRSRIIL